MTEKSSEIFRDFAKKFTCQLYYGLKNIGSGVLLKVDEDYFLVSAAHVLEEKMIREMFIPNGTELIPIEGDFKGIALKEGQKRENDKIDIAVVRLAATIIKEINSIFEFLEINSIELNHNITNLKEYCLYGFPNIWTEKIPEYKEFKTKPLQLRTQINREQTRTVPQYAENSKLIVEYGSNPSHPVAKGLSGSGLWYCPLNSINNEAIKLVGILTDCFSYDNVITVTRVDVLTEILRQKFELNIEQSKIIKVNIEESDS